MEKVTIIITALVALVSWLAALWYKKKANDEKYKRVQDEYVRDAQEVANAIQKAKLDDLIRDANVRLDARRKRIRKGK